MAAPAEVQTTRISSATSGTVRRSTDGDDLVALARVMGLPEALDSPRYVVTATTDEATNGPIWDSADPLADSNATENALTFEANSYTPLTAFVVMTNDDSLAFLTVRCLVKGGASNPTLEFAFENDVQISATFSSGVATRVAANSTPRTTIAKDTTGDYDLTFPACGAVQFVGGGLDPATDTAVSQALSASPRSLAIAGTGKLLFHDLATPTQEDPADGQKLYATLKCVAANGYGPRSTQAVADLVDCDADWAINTSSSPDSVELNVQGLGSTALNWKAAIWVGQSISLGFV